MNVNGVGSPVNIATTPPSNNSNSSNHLTPQMPSPQSEEYKLDFTNMAVEEKYIPPALSQNEISIASAPDSGNGNPSSPGLAKTIKNN